MNGTHFPKEKKVGLELSSHKRCALAKSMVFGLHPSVETADTIGTRRSERKGGWKMKRLVSLLLVVMLVLPCVGGVAEEFTLHSGTKFGMTLEEIKEIEEKSGYVVETTTDGSVWNPDDSLCLWIAKTDLLGIGGNIGYDFSPTTGLCNECFYMVVNPSTKSVSRKEITRTIEKYKSKYGEPVFSGEYADIASEAHDAIDGYLYNKEHFSSYPAPNELYQWWVEQEDGSVVDIILISYDEFLIGPELFISYSLRTENEMQVFTENYREDF